MAQPARPAHVALLACWGWCSWLPAPPALRRNEFVIVQECESRGAESAASRLGQFGEQRSTRLSQDEVVGVNCRTRWPAPAAVAISRSPSAQGRAIRDRSACAFALST